MTQNSVAMVSTYAPSRCGIARFSSLLSEAMLSWGRRTDIFRLVQKGDVPTAAGNVRMEFDPESSASIERARSLLRTYPAVIVQHEFGIFGPDDGLAVKQLLEGLGVPTVVVLHTVPLRPTSGQREIMTFLARTASVLVVPSHSARVALEDVFDIPAEAVSVLPHGSSWQPTEIATEGRHRLLTWGLLGPGKGIERAIKAVSMLPVLTPEPVYRVTGQTHPNVIRRHGNSYRESLESLIKSSGVEGRVILDEGYKSEDEMYQQLAAADVVVIPYDNNEQACSGVLTDAIRAGKPVVATNFPHARELLSSGAGLVVGHDDPAEMSDAIATLLTDDITYRRAVSQARYQGRRLSWNEVGRRYEEVLSRLTTSLAVS